MSSEEQTGIPPETPQSTEQIRQSEEDASTQEIQSLRSQIDSLRKGFNQKTQENEILNAKVKEMTAMLEFHQNDGQSQSELEALRARVLAKEYQINQQNHEIEALKLKIKEVTVGYAELQTLETIFQETNQDVLNSISASNLGLTVIKERINEQVRATFVEKHRIEIEALKTHCGNSSEQCRRKINGFEAHLTGILNIMTDEFGAYSEQQRAAAVAPVKEKKDEQEILQGNFISLQNKLSDAPREEGFVQDAGSERDEVVERNEDVGRDDDVGRHEDFVRDHFPKAGKKKRRYRN